MGGLQNDQQNQTFSTLRKSQFCVCFRQYKFVVALSRVVVIRKNQSGSSTFSQLPSIASFENDSANNLPKPSSSVENFTSFTEDPRKDLPWSPFVQAQIDKLPSQKVHQSSKGIFKVFGHSRSRSKSSLVKRQSTPRNVLNIFEPIKQSRIAINKTEFINTLQALQLKVYHWEHVKDIEDANGVTFLVIQVPNFVHQDHFLVLSWLKPSSEQSMQNVYAKILNEVQLQMRVRGTMNVSGVCLMGNNGVAIVTNQFEHDVMTLSVFCGELHRQLGRQLFGSDEYYTVLLCLFDIVIEIIRMLYFLHLEGIAHREILLDNFLICPQSRIVIFRGFSQSSYSIEGETRNRQKLSDLDQDSQQQQSEQKIHSFSLEKWLQVTNLNSLETFLENINQNQAEKLKQGQTEIFTSEKQDIFDVGILVLELFSGKQGFDQREITRNMLDLYNQQNELLIRIITDPVFLQCFVGASERPSTCQLVTKFEQVRQDIVRLIQGREQNERQFLIQT
eukprot:TRINITY_DN10452_c1_g1_i1.p1 TRINITY_DN10452_c1_g1~~TRINITY_DN10452_c1_g1_i1.p1  ORF type:complete len:512 (-),score=-13.99 TRINITY_DN10452_c1_g1_i1:180-1691(-)